MEVDISWREKFCSENFYAFSRETAARLGCSASSPSPATSHRISHKKVSVQVSCVWLHCKAQIGYTETPYDVYGRAPIQVRLLQQSLQSTCCYTSPWPASSSGT
ncbi:uncharacterized protein LOC142771872 isoform X2 [Rhipicephalus microplus]|uniref:uncharacterized protein LOC142771872 isoform X2 n=1 Tax=Rhipicephalus microplus TaxID=6941 RepID=UPI003F6BA446